jgi:hypothetical protein
VPNKIGRKLGQSLRVEVAKAIFDRDVFAVNVDRFSQTALERAQDATKSKIKLPRGTRWLRA